MQSFSPQGRSAPKTPGLTWITGGPTSALLTKRSSSKPFAPVALSALLIPSIPV